MIYSWLQVINSRYQFYARDVHLYDKPVLKFTCVNKDVQTWLLSGWQPHSFVRPSVRLSIRSFTTFSGCCTFVNNSLKRYSIQLGGMLMYPDDLPSAEIDADGYCCHFLRSSLRPTVCGLGFGYCGQIAWKKWPTIWHAYISRSLTLGCHRRLWLILSIRPAVSIWVCWGWDCGRRRGGLSLLLGMTIAITGGYVPW